MNVKSLLLKGSFYRTLNIVINMAVSVYIMPFLIYGIGERGYGMWLLISSILGHFGLMEMGFGRANQHSIVNALEKKDDQYLNRTVSTALAIYSFLALVSMLVVLGVVGAAPSFFDDPEEVRIFQIVVAIQGLQAALEFPIMSTRGILVAKLRYDILSYLQIAKLIGRTIFIIAIVGQSKSLLDLSLITFFSELVVYIITFGLAWRYCPQLRLSPSFVKLSEAKNLFNFGKWVFLITLANKFKIAIPNYVIAGAMSLGFVSHFAVAHRLFGYTSTLVNSMLNIFFPVFAKFHAQKDYAKMAEKYQFSMRLTLIVSVIAYGLLIILSELIIYLWMGEKFLDAHIPLLIFCVSGFLVTPTEQGVSLLYAMNKHRLYAFFNLGDTVLTLILSLALVGHWGMMGIALGYAIPILFKYVLVKIFINRLLKLSIRRWFQSILLFYFHVTVVLVLCAGLFNFLDGSLLGTVSATALFIVCYPISAFYLQLKRSERLQLFDTLPRPFRNDIVKRLI